MRIEKGITLVALIITIVVLMILAGVAISSINDSGMIGQAQNITTKWNEAANNEATMIGDYSNFIANFLGNNGCTHNWSNGKCTKCQLVCTHNGEKAYTYVPIDNIPDDPYLRNSTEHTKSTYCKICNKFEGEMVESCDFGGWPNEHPCTYCKENS